MESVSQVFHGPAGVFPPHMRDLSLHNPTIFGHTLDIWDANESACVQAPPSFKQWLTTESQ